MSRTFPSRGGRTSEERRKAEQSLMPLLKELTTQRPLPFDVVRSLDTLVRNHDFATLSENAPLTAEHETQKLYVHERDDQAFCMILPGKRAWTPERGVNIIVTHIDNPLLCLREQPTSFNMDHEDRFNHPGPYLGLQPAGGLYPPDWEGLTGHIRGRVIAKSGTEHLVKVSAKIPSTSLHLETDETQEASFNRIRAFIGAASVDEQHRQLRVRSEGGLGAAQLCFVPDTKWTRLGRDFISVYGLDDRTCVTAAVHAALRSAPMRPSFIFGLDAEEIGSTGGAGKTAGFFKHVINKYMTLRLHNDNLLTTEQLYDRGVLGTYPGLCGDVCPVMSHNEMEMPNTTPDEAARFGFGPFITSSKGFGANQVAPRYLGIVRDALDTRLKNSTHEKYQWVGSEFKSDDANIYSVSHFAQYFTDDHVPMVVVGTPVQDLHRPSGEMVYFWDWVLTVDAYQAYMEHNPPARNLRR